MSILTKNGNVITTLDGKVILKNDIQSSSPTTIWETTPSFTLSNNDKNASTTADANKSIISTNPKTSGKWYAEIQYIKPGYDYISNNQLTLLECGLDGGGGDLTINLGGGYNYGNTEYTARILADLDANPKILSIELYDEVGSLETSNSQTLPSGFPPAPSPIPYRLRVNVLQDQGVPDEVVEFELRTELSTIQYSVPSGYTVWG